MFATHDTNCLVFTVETLLYVHCNLGSKSLLLYFSKCHVSKATLELPPNVKDSKLHGARNPKFGKTFLPTDGWLKYESWKWVKIADQKTLRLKRQSNRQKAMPNTCWLHWLSYPVVSLSCNEARVQLKSRHSPHPPSSPLTETFRQHDLCPIVAKAFALCEWPVLGPNSRHSSNHDSPLHAKNILHFEAEVPGIPTRWLWAMKGNPLA
jgi:hypothetical protein